MDSNELRKKYLEFFQTKGHVIIPSASLIPENDPTTLFTGSGMQPILPYLLGQKHPAGTRICDSQKSFRSVDIDEVGDNRHTTFFEMLGNWSFGDYFKTEQIDWMWEFLIKEIGFDPQRIYITCFIGDETYGIPQDTQAAEKWQEKFQSVGIDAPIINDAEQNGLQNGRIFYYPANKNWWSRAGVPEKMPLGEPGGPDSEMFWDFGADKKLHENSQWKDKPCHVNCDCGRFMEIGNNVFMEYKKTEAGFEKLTQKNVDFGGGLERMVAATNNNPDIFYIDSFKQALEKLQNLSAKSYGKNDEETKAFRVILDHLRAATFLIADGAHPSNKDQGYFTRRLIRRSVRFGLNLGILKNFTAEIAKKYIDYYNETYPDLLQKQGKILEELQKEEEKFRATLEQGMKEFEKLAHGDISGHDAFILFSTYGFPLEMTIELASERGFKVDIEAFNKEFDQHQETSRTAAAGKFKGGLADHSEATTKLHTANHLVLAALRQVLGNHVYQKGSNITAERLRFDFSHPDKMTPEQINEVEKIVNEEIKKNLSVSWEIMPIEKARELGAMGVFGDKYGEEVKVYTIGDPQKPFSRELCGGPHVENTGILGRFKIVKEEASSAGVRRIKAILE